MKQVYFDNAATTQIRDEVIDKITEVMRGNYGNASSSHSFGRSSKSLIEKSRKTIASYLNVSAGEIVFTSGGTEADNLVLQSAVRDLKVTHIITSKIEHHAILHTTEQLKEEYKLDVSYVNIDKNGTIDYSHLERLLDTSEKTLVSLMHVNNEIGNLLDIKKVANLCNANNALFHSDTVQSVGHYKLDLQDIQLDFLAAAAHKFHGPKGVGFAYFKKGFGILPMLHGGDQEKGARSSTENVHSILGMEAALRVAISNIEKDEKYLLQLKKYFIAELKANFKDIAFNGNSEFVNKSSYTILNVRFSQANEMLLFSLDLSGIAVSGGSACQSGSSKGSHVLKEILDGLEADKTSVRFSFSKLTTKQEIDTTVLKLKELLN